jgi:hypothetical protein
LTVEELVHQVELQQDVDEAEALAGEVPQGVQVVALQKKIQIETTNWKQGDTGHWVLGVETSLSQDLRLCWIYVRG